MLNRVKLFENFQGEWTLLATMSRQDSVATYIAHRFEEVLTIQKQLAQCDQSLVDLRTDYDKKCEAIEIAMKNIRSQCTHLLTTYIPDPGGGRDSDKYCDICGETLK